MRTEEPNPRPRRRPRPLAGAGGRRAEILREAAHCFGSRGFKGTTTREVADRVGITEAALYRYFPSKDAIYAAILEGKIAEPGLLDELAPFAVAGEDREVFLRLARGLIERVEADPLFLRLLLYSALEGHERAREFHQTRIRRLREFLQRYLARRTREGAFRAVDPLVAARAFLGMLVDHLVWRQVLSPGRRESADAIAQGYVSIFLDGIRAPRRPGRG